MQIVKTSRFLDELAVILDFIAEDNLNNAILFLNNLSDSISSLPEMPLKCRQSTKSRDKTIRDLIFNGYVVPYRINKPKNRIEIIGIFSANEWDLDGQ
jgi:plasmid stabilization system protein ParE